MSEIALARINSFASTTTRADFVPPSEQLITLTIGQLQEMIVQAVQRAIQPLQDEVMQLRAILDLQDEKIVVLEATEEHDVNRICLDIAHDRQRISKLETRPTTPAPAAAPRGEKTIARIAKIEEVLKSRGPTTLKQLEHILKISPKEMNRLLVKLDMRRYELHARPGDAREKVIRLKVQIR
jgi:hypothetical protein